MIAYARSNANRKPEFRILTCIVKEDGTTYVLKKPLLPAGRDHVASLEAKYRLLAQAFKDSPINIDLQQPTVLANGSAHMPFVEGNQLSKRFQSQLLMNDQRGALNTLKSLVEIIDAMPAKKVTFTDKSGFSQLFGPHFMGEHQAIECGYIDFNLDNIIKIDGAYDVIDYEWCFDFPVPREYIIGRFFLSYFFKYNRLFMSLSSNSMPMVELGHYWFVPKFIYDEFKLSRIHFRKVARAEAAFQNYVNTYQSKPVRIHTQSIIHRGPLFVSFSEQTERQLAEFQNHVHNVNAEIQQLSSELLRMRRSPLWHLSSVGGRTIRRLRRP